MRVYVAEELKDHTQFDAELFAGAFKDLQEEGVLTLANIRGVEDRVSDRLRRQMARQEGFANTARTEMLPKMADFLHFGR